MQAIDDLTRLPAGRFAHREPGSGAARLLTDALAARGLAVAEGPVAHSHEEVARLVAWGMVDAGIGIESQALAAGLGFLPLVEERFDLLVDEAQLATPKVARLFDVLANRSFREDAARVPGYDLGEVGRTARVG